MKLLSAFILSWAAGLAAYLGVLAGLHGEYVDSINVIGMIALTLLATAVAAAVIYAPVMFALRRVFNMRVVGWWAFPLAGIGLGVLPVLAIIVMFGGHLDSHDLLSPESTLFFCMFGTFGAVFGEGFFIAYSRNSA